jgi:uncharacterized membrane protein
LSKKKSRRRRAAAGPAPGAVAVPPRSLTESGLPDEEYRRLFRICGWYVAAAATVFAAALSILSWMRYRDFADGRFDLGNMVQAVYNTAHGRFLEMTDPYSAMPVSRLGSHVDPILALFAPLWWVWHSPVMLLVAQAVIVAASAWPVYRLGARLFKDPRPAALLAGALLLYPPLQFTVLSEFHPVALAIPLLLFAFLYLEEDRLLRALPFLVLAALCKEEIPLVIALMAGYFVLRKRSWRPLLVAAVAVAYFALAVGVIMPHYHKGGPPALLARFAQYGTGTGEIMKNVVSRPGHTVRDLAAADNLRYWRDLLWPVGYTALISPLTTLISAPELLINGLSSRAQQRVVTYHYSAGIIALVFAGVILAFVRVRRWVIWLGGRPQLARRRWATAGARWLNYDTFALALFVLCAYSVYVMGPLPLPFAEAADTGASYAYTTHAKVLQAAVNTIPANAIVSANNNAGAQLSARRTIYTFPVISDAQYILVDTTRPFVFDEIDTTGVTYSTVLAELIKNTSLKRVFAQDGVFVFEVPPTAK